MPNSNNITKQVETTAPYTSSTNSNLLNNMVDESLNGVSPTSLPVEESSLNSEDYLRLIQAKRQDGIFSSLTEKTIYPINIRSSKDENPIKRVENNIGISYNYVSDKSSIFKDKLVKNNVAKQIRNDRYWGKRKDATTLRSPSTEITYTTDPNAPCIISESRTGTASYTQINERGVFSENQEVEIHVLTSPNNYSFGTSQNFDPVEPRGSQTPMRFYNHNSGRTLSFTAEFHQQEYPLEPLLSIAEKAQYLARPYRHGDYALIPKLVKIQIPGRVFRGYLQSVSVQTSGDDYRSWNFMNIRDNVGRLGEDTGFYGGYESRELEPRGGVANSRKDIITDNQNVYYGLSKMTLDFSLLIVEDIVLTTYETQEEISERKLLEQEAEQQRLEELENMLDYSQAREEVEANRSEYDFTPVDDCIYVDAETGEVVGYKFIDANGNEVEWYEGARYGSITLTEWLKKKEINKGDVIKQEPLVGPVEVQSESMWGIISDGNSRDSMTSYLQEKWKQDHPEPPQGTPEHDAWVAERDAYNNSLKNIPFLVDEYKRVAITDGMEEENYNMAYFSNASISVGKSGGEVKEMAYTPTQLKEFLTLPINTTNDIGKVLGSIGLDQGADPYIILQQIENGGIDNKESYPLLIRICCENGLGIDIFDSLGSQKYGISDWDKPFRSNNSTGFCFRRENIKRIFSEVGLSILDTNIDRYFECISDSGYCDVKNDSWLGVSFSTLAKIKDFSKFTLTTSSSGDRLDEPDTTINQFFIKAISIIRAIFYYGFKKTCTETITEDGAKLFPNEIAAKSYMNEHNVDVAYYWEYKEERSLL